MNIKQQIIIIIGVLLVVFCGLFLPYEGEYLREGDNFKRYMGYYLLFSPPSEMEIYQEIFGETLRSLVSERCLRKCGSHIITSQVFIQEITIVLAVFGVFLLFGRRKK